MNSAADVSVAGSHYFARFRRRGGALFRLDTRVYLTATVEPMPADNCIGCIIGKNPGSAQPRSGARRSVAISLDGDRFLPNLRAIVAGAYRHAGREPPAGAYIQVLNLFYLCDRDLRAAKATIGEISAPLVCPAERTAFPWAWYAWGAADRQLDPLKARFRALRAKQSFYYDSRSDTVMGETPGAAAMARHTQGMPHAPIIKHLGSLLAAQQA